MLLWRKSYATPGIMVVRPQQRSAPIITSKLLKKVAPQPTMSGEAHAPQQLAQPISEGYSWDNEATVNSKPRINRGYHRPPLDALLNQGTAPNPLLNQEGSLTNSNQSATVLAYDWRRGRW
jgi:hypothetical protein